MQIIKRNLKMNKNNSWNRLPYIILAVWLILSCKSAFSQRSSDNFLLDSLQKKTVNILKQNLNSLSGWNKVHAAEYLIWTKHPEDVGPIFLNQNEHFGKQPEYRIGIWRVLAQTMQFSREKEKWTNKIKEAFFDTLGLDRIHAAETLAKLKISPLKEGPIITFEALQSDSTTLSLYTRWSVSYSSKNLLLSEQKWLLKFLQLNKKASERRLAAYIISKLGILCQQDWLMLSSQALEEPTHSEAKVFLLSAAFVTAPKSVEQLYCYKDIKTTLFALGGKDSKSGRTEMAVALAAKGRAEDINVLTSLLNTKYPLPVETDNRDVQSAACYGILSIISRELKN